MPAVSPLAEYPPVMLFAEYRTVLQHDEDIKSGFEDPRPDRTPITALARANPGARQR